MKGGGRPIAFVRTITALFVATVLGYAVWSAFTGHSAPTGLRVGFFTDSFTYMRGAKDPVWTRAFLAQRFGGPFPFLLLAKLCARNLRVIVVVQSVVSAASWLLLAHTVAGLIDNARVRTVAFAAILLLALSPPVLQWNAAILTESLSLSALVVTIALLIEVVVNDHALPWFLVSLVVLALVHDANAYALLAATSFCAVGALRSERRRRALVIAAVCLVGGLAGIGFANRAQRWYQPLVETISVRVLPSGSTRNYFVAHGMPWGSAVISLEGQYTFRTKAFQNSESLAPFRQWLTDNGRSTYLGFLATHPAWALSQPFGGRAAVLAPRLRAYSSKFHNEPRGVLHVLGAVSFPESENLIELWIVGALGAGIALARRREARALLVAIAIIGFLAIVEYFVAWHGDAFEVDRHSLSSAVALRVLLFVVSLLALDRYVSSRAVVAGGDG